MAIPHQITDGSFATAVQNGPGTWSLPFQDKGDTQSFEYKAMFRQDQSTYVPLQNSYNAYTGREYLSSIVTARGVAYLVSESDTRAIGNGLLEFERTYASLPRTRYEGGSLPYSLQNLQESPAEVQNLILTLNSRIKYEYFLTQPDVLVAQRVEVVFGSVVTFGGWAIDSIPEGSEFLAEDSETTIYKGFFQRRSILVTAPETSTL